MTTRHYISPENVWCIGEVAGGGWVIDLDLKDGTAMRKGVFRSFEDAEEALLSFFQHYGLHWDRLES